MIGKLITRIEKLPTLWQWAVYGLVAFVVIGVITVTFGRIRSCSFNKDLAAYEARDKEHEKKETELRAKADAADARAEVAEARADKLNAQVLAYEALADDKKRLDESISQKIDTLTTEAVNEAANTDAPTDCNVRAERTCAKFRNLKPPIDFDCAEYKRRLCQTAR